VNCEAKEDALVYKIFNSQLGKSELFYFFKEHFFSISIFINLPIFNQDFYKTYDSILDKLVHLPYQVNLNLITISAHIINGTPSSKPHEDYHKIHWKFLLFKK